jgi:16S rRNA (cytidine1402-2'-O)-methyltransferase
VDRHRRDAALRSEQPAPAEERAILEAALLLRPAVLEPGALYVVAMPIGDIEDISIRALRVLRSVSVIAAENPARTRRLLRPYGVGTEVTGYRDRRDGAAISALLGRLKRGDSVALVCDAGTPLIADAGAQLALAAIDSAIPLVPVPGPVAAVAALMAAGHAEGRFVFDGFPPRSRSDRFAYFAGLAAEPRTIILYETRPYLRDTLERLRDAIGGDRPILIARDITKPTARIFRLTTATAPGILRTPGRGEYTIVISYADAPAQAIGAAKLDTTVSGE